MTTTKKNPKTRFVCSTFAALTASICVIAMLAEAQQPILKIASLGTNQFSVQVTNGLSTTNYTLFWTPAVQSPNYPWVVSQVGTIGQTNFLIDGGEWNSGYFRVLLGTDSDGDGFPDWQDAQPGNPAVGILSLTIDSPTNGMVFQ